MERAWLPKCQKCKIGDLVPLSDYGGGGAAVHYKAWVCTNPECGFNIKIKNGEIFINAPIRRGEEELFRERAGYSR